ncbi:hypothetical protein HELRODRAFT_62550 [Helobdella robusta]|uniref:RRM domain-containing protein n=1 Tax=Helobdella robusta TaxID=6412 RepID=T1FX22_HELRO|nr:hypothetical protein HELRODRAFT_62550 [Helobdella robusta]ESO12524.1 hypothetical protein HELRODRAFT_62550 [Helobdella robusta]
MALFGVCVDTSEAVELFSPHGLYLKPIAKLNISVQLPAMKSPGQSISNWELMEKLKKMIKPEQFLVLKVAKTTLEFVRFEGEVESKSRLKFMLNQLENKTIKLSGFTEVLKVKAAEAKTQGPTRHDWDSFFRDAKDMDEMKAGERPDTVHVKDLPCRWFANKIEKDIPNEFIVRKVFETFGRINALDIPILNPCNKDLSSAKGAIKTFSFGQDFLFEVFIQYKEYLSFEKAMMAFRGMKLLFKESENKSLTAYIKVDFDKTKHLSEKSIRKRKIEIERFHKSEREKEEALERERLRELKLKEELLRKQEEEEQEREKKREEKLRLRRERQQVREERRKIRKMEKKRVEEEKRMQMRIALEERKILIAQRKLETIRLLSELFNRIKVSFC